MIYINYSGQFGNCMFQYVFARLIAEHNKLNLITHGPLELECTTPMLYKESELKKGTITITDEYYHQYRLTNGSKLFDLDPDYDYVISGYFQDAELYNKHVDIIRKFFLIDYIEPENLIDKTLVMVRLGDFNHSGYNSEIIHYNWYKDVFKNIQNQKVFTLTNNGRERAQTTEEQEKIYRSKIITMEDEILPRHENMYKEFIETMKYKQIVCSNSTWGWWASFLSSATKIYTFAKFGSFGVQELKSHGIHINKLFNIRNVSQVIDGEFIDMKQLR